MQDRIKQALQQIAKDEQVRIVYVCDSSHSLQHSPFQCYYFQKGEELTTCDEYREFSN